MTTLTKRLLMTAVGALALAGLGGLTPAPHAAARGVAAQPNPATSPAGKALVRRITQRFPKATVQINRIGGHTTAYALYVTLAAQPGASLSGGAGAQVLAWYLQTYPRQAVYALYSYEKDSDGMGFWEYEFVPTAKVLRRYRFSFTVKQSYPWTSWQLSTADVLRAAKAGKWPKGVTHTPVRPATTPAPKKKK